METKNGAEKAHVKGKERHLAIQAIVNAAKQANNQQTIWNQNISSLTRTKQRVEDPLRFLKSNQAAHKSSRRMHYYLYIVCK